MEKGKRGLEMEERGIDGIVLMRFMSHGHGFYI